MKTHHKYNSFHSGTYLQKTILFIKCICGSPFTSYNLLVNHIVFGFLMSCMLIVRVSSALFCLIGVGYHLELCIAIY